MATSDTLRVYRPQRFPTLDSDPSTFLTSEHEAIAESLSTMHEVIRELDTTATPLVSAANDAAAAVAGVPLYGLYHNSGAVKVRLV